MKVESIKAPTKDRIQAVLTALEALERQPARLPAKATKAIREVGKQIDGAKSIAGMSRELKKAIADKRYADVEGMDQALSLAVDALADGASTIYSPDYYRRTFPDTKDTGEVTVMTFTVGAKDSEGIITGGVSGCLIGAAGGTVALPGGMTAVGCAGVGLVGGLIGGIGGSAAAAVDGLLSLLW